MFAYGAKRTSELLPRHVRYLVANEGIADMDRLALGYALASITRLTGIGCHPT
jgi:hypothetical protein